jgi:hypothetical protein
MTAKPPDESLQRAAVAIQLSVVIMETHLAEPEIGNELFTLLYEEWLREGRSRNWIAAAEDAIDDIRLIGFVKDERDQKWRLITEWNRE